MVKRFFAFLVGFLVVSVTLTSSVLALSIAPPMPQPAPNELPLGQRHFYTTTFRGNGEAVVSLKVILTNDDTVNNLSEVVFISPVKISDPLAFQVISTPRCLQYVYEPDEGGRSVQKCASFGPDDYLSYYSVSGASYKKAKVEADGQALKITLPEPISPEKNGAVVVNFRSFGYAKKNVWGGFAYEFESLKINEKIAELTVGINTDSSDLFLKGVKGSVDYIDEAPASFKSAAAGEALTSSTVDHYYSSIGSGRTTKRTTNLSNMESYIIKGAFAKSRVVLYAKEFLAGVGVIVGILILVFWVGRFIVRKEGKSQVSTPGRGSFLPALGASFVSSLIVAGYTVLISIVPRIVFGSYYSRYIGILIIFLILISFFVYSLLFFGPGIYFGIKKGVGWGIAVFALNVFWLMIFTGITLAAIFLLGNWPYSPPTIY